MSPCGCEGVFREIQHREKFVNTISWTDDQYRVKAAIQDSQKSCSITSDNARKCSSLTRPSHYNVLNPRKPWVKVSISFLKLFLWGVGHSGDNTKRLGSLSGKKFRSLFDLRQTFDWNSTFTLREYSRNVCWLKHFKLGELSSTPRVERLQHGFYRPDLEQHRLSICSTKTGSVKSPGRRMCLLTG